MPCDSSYMEATGLEREMGRVYSLLEEVSGEIFDHSKSDYHPRVYSESISRETGDIWVKRLCAKCKRLGPQITDYSLELQMWWRDHQIADAKRESKEEEERRKQQIKRDALNKLSKKERDVLRELL